MPNARSSVEAQKGGWEPLSGPTHHDATTEDDAAALSALWAVVVARLGGATKSRLAPLLGSAARQHLALAMLEDVLGVCTTAGLRAVLAVLDEAAAEALGGPAGVQVVGEPAGGRGGMNAAALAGLQAARAQGASQVLVLPGDVPLVSHRDLLRLARAAGPAVRAVVVGASADGTGTNALLLRPPEVIAPSFGPPSVGRHLAAGLAAGARTRRCERLDLALDVDTPADLAALYARRPGGRTGQALAALLDGGLRLDAGSRPRRA